MHFILFYFILGSKDLTWDLAHTSNHLTTQLSFNFYFEMRLPRQALNLLWSCLSLSSSWFSGLHHQAWLVGVVISDRTKAGLSNAWPVTLCIGGTLLLQPKSQSLLLPACHSLPNRKREQLAPIALFSDLFTVSKAFGVWLGPAVRLSARKQDEGLTVRALGISTLM